MAKSKFITLALLGMAHGLAFETASSLQADPISESIIVPPQAVMSESELLTRLNENGRRLFNSLDSEGKALALKLANQSCKGKNDCKGTNSCKTDENGCAGLADCKGRSRGPFEDKNLAIKVAAMKMAQKRAQINQGK